MKLVFWKSIFVLFIFLGFFCLEGKSIKASKHDLSVSGTGDLKVTNMNNICIFCHTSHSSVTSSNKPLWNRKEEAPVYSVYKSTTLVSKIDQPDGASKLCLSCHDGNIALGQIDRGPKELMFLNSSDGRIPRGRKSNLGENITDDHPISFNSSLVVSSSIEYKHPSIDDEVKYDKKGKIQCTSCHNVHDNVFGKFLVKDNRRAMICKSCHIPEGYSGISTHDISTASWMGTGQNPWPHTSYNSVGDNSCANCHRSHNAKGSERLLSSMADDLVCLICHNGKVGGNIRGEIEKPFAHNVGLYNNIHEPNEDVLLSPFHVQCVDCHNPHKVSQKKSSAPFVNGSLEGVKGINIVGAVIPRAQFEYEVCFKCHGQEKYNNPVVARMDKNLNVRIAFSPNNTSYHNVTSQKTTSNTFSLKTGWDNNSWIYCTDCHNSNNARKNGGSAPNGPHGSSYEHLLESRYLVSTSMPYQQSNYDLCWKCHRPEIVMGENFSTFKYHKKHVDEQNTPCSVCHDPHGSRQNVGLINFDTSAVFPNLNGELKFEVIGNKGYCFLQCHGEDHSPEDYER